MDIERLAMQGTEMPDGLDLPEQLLFLTLRELYSNFRAGKVNRERGRREKNRIMVAYEDLRSRYAIMDYHMKIRRRLEREVGSLYRCDCEHCRQVAAIMDGIDRKDIPEDIKEVNAWNEKLRELVRQRSERAAELATQLDRVRWALDGDLSPEAMIEKIKEVVKNA